MGFSEDLIREIVERTLREMSGAEMEKHIDPSGVMSIKTSTVK